MYANAEGAWIPVVNVEGAQRNIPRETGGDGRVYVYRLPGGQTARLRLWVPLDGQLRLDITGDWIKYELVGGKVVPLGPTGPATRTIVHPGATGWTVAAPEQVFKVMTSVAFPGKGNFKLLTGSYVYAGSGWADLQVGRVDAGTEQTRPFTPGLLYSACAAPPDVVTPSSSAELPAARAEIRLRRLTSLDLNPGASFDFAAPVSQRAAQPLSLSNAGPEGSLARYQLVTSGTVRPADLNAQVAVRAARGVLASGQRADLTLGALCWPTPGPYQSTFDLLYAVGETYDGSEPSAQDGARPGDLLYRRAALTGRLSCLE